MPEVTAKVAIIKGLNPDILSRLDAHITNVAGMNTSGLETAEARLGKIGYQQILMYLKQGNLLNLTEQGEGAAGLPPTPLKSAL